MNENLFVVKTLDEFSISRNGEELKFKTKKSQALFFYLIVEDYFQPGVKHARSKLAELLWTGTPVKSAMENLRQATYQLRRVLPSNGEKQSPVCSDRQHIWINSKLEYALDVEALLHQYHDDLIHAPEESLSIEKVFLSHFFLPQADGFDEWIIQKRSQIKDILLQCLRDALEELDKQEMWEQGLIVARQLIHLDAHSEVGHRYLAKCLVKTGNRVKATSLLHRYENRMQTEYNTTLSAHTWAVLEEYEPVGNAETAHSGPNKRSGLFAIGVLLFAILGLITFLFSSQSGSSPTTLRPSNDSTVPSDNSLAVLPFDNIPESTKPDPLVTGFTDDLITSLTQYGDWKVISRTSSMRYRNTEKSLQQIAEELKIRYIVEGSIQRSDGRIRLNVRLVDAQKDQQIWGHSFEEAITGAFQLQANLTNEIANQLSAIHPNRPVIIRQEVDPAAHELFLKGRRLLLVEASPEAFDSALVYFEQALAIDPSYDELHLYMAETLGGLCSWWGEGRRHMPDEYPKIIQHLDSLADRPDLRADVERILGWTHLWRFDVYQAIPHFQRSVTENPFIEYGFSGLGFAYMLAGKFESALAAVRKAKELNPEIGHIYVVEAEVLAITGRFKEAHQSIDLALQYTPGYKVAHARKAWIHMMEGEASKAIAVLDSLTKHIQPAPYYMEGFRAAALALDGRVEEAHQALRSMKALSGQGQYAYSFYIALTHMLLHEYDQASGWMEKALKDPHPDANWFRVDPLFDEARSRPWYSALLKKYSRNEQ